MYSHVYNPEVFLDASCDLWLQFYSSFPVHHAKPSHEHQDAGFSAGLLEIVPQTSATTI